MLYLFNHVPAMAQASATGCGLPPQRVIAHMPMPCGLSVQVRVLGANLGRPRLRAHPHRSVRMIFRLADYFFAVVL